MVLVLPMSKPYKFTNQIENVDKCVKTRGVRLFIKNTQVAIQVSADKINDEPWALPSVQVPQSRILYDQWRDLTEAVELAFAEYHTRFELTDEKLVLIEEKSNG